eukprot:8432341-Ditylum_brightwellii.AAC.1
MKMLRHIPSQQSTNRDQKERSFARVLPKGEIVVKRGHPRKIVNLRYSTINNQQAGMGRNNGVRDIAHKRLSAK